MEKVYEVLHLTFHWYFIIDGGFKMAAFGGLFMIKFFFIINPSASSN